MRKITTLLLLTVVGLVLAMACGGEGTHPSRLAFYHDAYGNRNIYTSNPAGSNLTFLTPTLPSEGFPSSPPTAPRPTFFAPRADGSGLANLTDDPAEDAIPAWSPDGARIAFYSDR